LLSCGEEAAKATERRFITIFGHPRIHARERWFVAPPPVIVRLTLRSVAVRSLGHVWAGHAASTRSK
jgi:hypothetical protein